MTLRRRRDVDDARVFNEAGRDFLLDFADRVGLALDNAQLAESHRQAELALWESEQQRRQILASMLQAEEAERTRIATELHDDTVQVMTAALIRLDQLAPAAARGDHHGVTRAVARARQTLAEATERTRRLMFELRPTVLHDYGLVEATRVLLEQTAREAGVQTELRGTVGRYHLALEEAIYRSVQEALTNVRRHAGASTVTVTFAERDGVLVCDVEDDGRGFDPVEARERPTAALHLGLRSTIERVRAAGGDVIIASDPGQGTHVQIAAPVERRAKPRRALVAAPR